MALRKLNQEIEKKFKQISEGIGTFQSTYDKLQQATNQAQKEKLEDTLKTQIKKLQRHRDQLKSWAASNEVKDKKPLLEYRKSIENEMEKFKAVEKEMKTKAFSKEGLSAAAKLDPKEKEKADLCSFLSDMNDELGRQIETLEAEEDGLTATVKKGKKDTAKAERVAEINRMMERHRWHQNKLELVLRALENGTVETEQVNEGVKDGIKYYVEDNQTMDFIEDDTLYDEFDLGQDEVAWGLNNDADKGSSQDTQSVHEENVDSGEVKTTTGKGKTVAEPPGITARRPSNQLKSPLPALATLHTPLANTTNMQAPTSMKPAPPPSRPPGETLKYASAAAAAASSDKSIAPLPPPPTTTSTLAPLPPPPSKSSANTSPAVVPSIPAGSQPAVQKSNAPTPPTSQPISQVVSRSPTMSQAATGSVPPTPALESSEPAPLSKTRSAQALEAPQEDQEPFTDPEEPETPPPANGTTNGAMKDDQPESIYHLPPCLSDLVSTFNATSTRSSDPTSAEVQRLINMSYENSVDASDVERPRFYRPQNRYHVPSHYPTQPSGILDDHTLYERIDNDTLFFLFYYRQNTYQQYQAAKALKSQSWRFHKQYQTWFQRHEEPKTITEEYEQGTYRFFDYESTWMNRRKAEFKFAYRFLEDDL